MAAPVFVAGSANNAATASGTTHAVVVTTPAGTAAGHLLIAYMYGASGAVSTIPAPSGWTLTGTVQSGASAVGGGAWFWKIAASEPANYTFTYTTATATTGFPACSIGAWSLASGIDAGPAWTPTATSSTAAVAPAVTAATAPSLLVCGFGSFSGAASFTPPTGMTTRASTFNSGNMSNVMVSLDLAAAGATGTKTGTWPAASPGLYTSIVVAGSVVSSPVRRVGKMRW